MTTSTLMARGRMQPRTIIGTVSGSEFIVSMWPASGFLLALGSAGIQWDIVAAMLLGGSIAAPISAWLVRHFDDRALGTAVGGLIILINLDRLLLLFGADPGFVTTVRLVAMASVLIILVLVSRGRAKRVAEPMVGADPWSTQTRSPPPRERKPAEKARRPDPSATRAPLPSRRPAGGGFHYPDGLTGFARLADHLTGIPTI